MKTPLGKPLIDVFKEEAEALDYRALSDLIFCYIRRMDPGSLLTNEVCQNMATSLTDFVTDSTRKYLHGQAEHGGDIRDRDLEAELRNEDIDRFWYFSAKRWPRRPQGGRRRVE